MPQQLCMCSTATAPRRSTFSLSHQASTTAQVTGRHLAKCSAVCGAESCDPSKLVPNSVLPYGKCNGEVSGISFSVSHFPTASRARHSLDCEMVALLAPKGNRTHEAVCRMLFRDRKVDLAPLYLKLVLKDLYFFNVITDSVRKNHLWDRLCHKIHSPCCWFLSHRVLVRVEFGK